MNAYRIQNDIVAARDAQDAIRAWAEHYQAPYNSAGPVETVNPAELEISIEDEDGEYRDGKLSEVMPIDGPAEIVAFGDCENCG